MCTERWLAFRNFKEPMPVFSNIIFNFEACGIERTIIGRFPIVQGSVAVVLQSHQFKNLPSKITFSLINKATKRGRR